jgi:predicted transcriptional regulator/predicted O-methyltransferase YrrM
MTAEDTNQAREATPEEILEIVYGFRRSRILLTAYELDVFSELGDERKTSAQVAASLDTDVRGTDRLLNALCAMGLLEKEQGGFRNTRAASRLLVRGRPEFMAGLGHSVHLWDTWSHLTEAVRSGKPPVRKHVEDRGTDWLDAFIAAMHWRGVKQAEAVASLLDLRSVGCVLDVGGGSGAFSMAFVRANDRLRAFVFDLPSVVPITRRCVEEAGLSDKISMIAGNYETDHLGTGYDLVFLSAVIHSNPPEGNAALLRKCAAAANTNGRVAVLDYIVDEDRVHPPAGALFALNMLVSTQGGDTYTESDVRGWMSAAGLTSIIRKNTQFGASMLIGTKE